MSEAISIIHTDAKAVAPSQVNKLPRSAVWSLMHYAIFKDERIVIKWRLQVQQVGGTVCPLYLFS